MIRNSIKIFVFLMFCTITHVRATMPDWIAIEFMDIGRGLELLGFAGSVTCLSDTEITSILESTSGDMREHIEMILMRIEELPEKTQQKIAQKAEQLNQKISAQKNKCLDEIEAIKQLWNNFNGAYEEQSKHRTKLSKELIKHLVTFLVAFKKHQLSLALMVYNELIQLEELQDELAKDEASLDLFVTS